MNSAENTGSVPSFGTFSGGKALCGAEPCCGCAACGAVCPSGAIVMEENRENGFLYPAVKKERCIRCGRCVGICRRIHKPQENAYVSRAYAAVSRDDEARFRAASGAMFETLAGAVLRDGGAAAGAAYTDRLRGAEHVLARDASQLPGLCGTKYFQSDMRKIYGELETFIGETKRAALFCGTPCQVRAVKVFAEGKNIAGKLYTVDLICRGVPSPLVWRKYLAHLEERSRKRIRAIKVKDKERGWDKIGVMVTFEDGSRLYEQWLESVFERSFIQTNLAIRDSCFTCPYKSVHREGDLTIGDFWGFCHSRLLDGNMGTSLLMVNSKKGEELFRRIQKDIDCQISTVWRVRRGNLPAFGPVSCDGEERARFWRLLGEGKDLEEAMNTASPSSKNWREGEGTERGDMRHEARKRDR